MKMSYCNPSQTLAGACVRKVLSLLVMAAAVAAANAQPASPEPRRGYADPTAPAVLPVGPDIAPVMRPALVDTLATVRQRGTLRVGVVQVPPMVMLDRSSRYVGFSIDLARRLADDIGVRVEFVETSWSEVMAQLLERRTDVIITGLWLNVPRALVVNFTQPTASEALYLFAARGQGGQRRGLEPFNLPGTRIAVADDPAHLAAARSRFPRAQLLPTHDDPLTLLRSGRAQAAVLATLSPEAVLASQRGRWYLPSTEALSRTATAMAVRKGDHDFLAFLNTWLDIQRESGWLAERARHWSTSVEGFN